MLNLLADATRRLRDPGLLGQVLRFIIVGGLAFVLDAGVLKALVWTGLSPLLARTVSLSAAVTFTWALNRTLTFGTGRPPSLSEFTHYVVASAIGLAINYGVYTAAVVLKAPLLVALALGTVAGSTFNFLRYRMLLATPEA